MPCLKTHAFGVLRAGRPPFPGHLDSRFRGNDGVEVSLGSGQAGSGGRS